MIRVERKLVLEEKLRNAHGRPEILTLPAQTIPRDDPEYGIPSRKGVLQWRLSMLRRVPVFAINPTQELTLSSTRQSTLPHNHPDNFPSAPHSQAQTSHPKPPPVPMNE
jgi:hypothetical protein